MMLYTGFSNGVIFFSFTTPFISITMLDTKVNGIMPLFSTIAANSISHLKPVILPSL